MEQKAFTKWKEEDRERLIQLQHQGKTVNEIAVIMDKSLSSVYQNLSRRGMRANRKPTKVRKKQVYVPRAPKRDTISLVPMKDDEEPTYFANPIREELIDRTTMLPESYKESRIYKLIHNK